VAEGISVLFGPEAGGLSLHSGFRVERGWCTGILQTPVSFGSKVREDLLHNISTLCPKSTI
jgi:hypothetical protein